jgi:hypothetical protein
MRGLKNGKRLRVLSAINFRTFRNKVVFDDSKYQQSMC